MPLPDGLSFIYQNSPSTLGLYLSIDRTGNYLAFDMTTVTSVSVLVTFPGGNQATWTLTPVPSLTTVGTLVAKRAFQPGDTSTLGMLTLVATPYVGGTPLPPAGPWKVPVKGPPLS